MMKLDPGFPDALKQLEKERGINVEESRYAIESALVAAYKKTYASREYLTVRFSPEMTTLHVYQRKNVVELVTNPNEEISLEDAQAIKPDVAVDDRVDIEIDVSSKDFGRLAMNVVKQVITQKLRDAERKAILEEYRDREGQILTGVVQRLEKENVIVKIGRTEMVLLKSEQIPGEHFRVADRLKVYLTESKLPQREAQIMISRAHPQFVQKLFELEVPEVADGTVSIKSIAREAGYRTKIAVVASRPNIDPVGSCIGARGSRIQAVVSDLNGEKIDIVRWSEDPKDFVTAALSPAKVMSVEIVEGQREAHVIVADTQLSLAIGREGQNVRLAARLTGCHIDIESESKAKSRKNAAASRSGGA